MAPDGQSSKARETDSRRCSMSIVPRSRLMRCVTTMNLARSHGRHRSGIASHTKYAASSRPSIKQPYRTISKPIGSQKPTNIDNNNIAYWILRSSENRSVLANNSPMRRPSGSGIVTVPFVIRSHCDPKIRYSTNFRI